MLFLSSQSTVWLTLPLFLLKSGVLLVAFYSLLKIFYNIYLHPLRSFPGPRSHAATWLPYSLNHIKGRSPFLVKSLHDRYGPVVRIAPGALSFTSAAASKDIYGRTVPHQNPKDFLSRPHRIKELPRSIIFADDAVHGRHRRLLSHAFSSKALEAQEPLIRSHVDLLIEQLQKRTANNGEAVNIVSWYNFITFDVIGDLSFGASFNCLPTGNYHPWIKTIFESVRCGTIAAELIRWIPQSLIQKLAPKSLLKKRSEFIQFTRDRVTARLTLGEGDRPDFTSFMIKNRGLEKDGKVSLSDDEIMSNSMVLVLAGSETTATLLSGVTYHLLRNPDAMRRAVQEVRGTFADEEEITFASISKLKYLLACLNEGMRIYPPVAGALFRKIEGEASFIDGHLVPPDTSVGVYQWAAHQSNDNFARPESFVPERWLDNPDPIYANDRKDAVQPFSLGPRNCLGRNLAYVEMRLILARILFHFDIELVDKDQDWTAQDVYFIWEKKPLMVRLTKAQIT